MTDNIENVHGGNILDADVDAVVNPVNCVGVMGKGLALQFKTRYPKMFEQYAIACKQGWVKPGTMNTHVVSGDGPRWVINFPTKDHWKSPSKIGYISIGIIGLIRTIHELDITSVAIPPLGCGLGGLSWSDVEPLIRQVAEALPDVKVLIFHPHPVDAP